LQQVQEILIGGLLQDGMCKLYSKLLQQSCGTCPTDCCEPVSGCSQHLQKQLATNQNDHKVYQINLTTKTGKFRVMSILYIILKEKKTVQQNVGKWNTCCSN
jgi:hypothetical protein